MDEKRSEPGGCAPFMKRGRGVVSRVDSTESRRATMRADENVAVMRRAYEAFNTGDVETLTELFDESAVWHLPGRSSMANDYQGREATLAYFGQIGQETGGTFRAELQDLTADEDDRVVGIQRSTGERNG